MTAHAISTRRPRISPFVYPIVYFSLVITVGAVLLHSPFSLARGPISWINALFTATSATCVTGLVVVDTGTFFTGWGQAVIAGLIQLGGIGIMTVTGLIFYLWRRRISLVDRVAVGDSLLHDASFNLGGFLAQVILWSLAIEAVGAVLIFLEAPAAFSPLSAGFHAVSAFCNAGFALTGDSLMTWKSRWDLNLTFMALIILGGIGFGVLVEIRLWIATRQPLQRKNVRRHQMSWYATVILKTTAFLIIAGTIVIFLSEMINPHTHHTLLTALFQSVSCRTAGFNTVDIDQMTNVSLLVMVLLMFIGAAPGSCAGGIKVTTARTLLAFVRAQLRGSRQAEIGRFAVDRVTLNKALTLLIFAGVLVAVSVLVLNVTESSGIPHPQTRGLSLDILFEAVSAFGTVGLSTGLTPHLSTAGRVIIILLMFIGRLGPILFLSALQSYQKEIRYEKPEESLLIG